MTVRESLERLEEQYLSPYASLSCESLGRDRDEPQCDIRPVYQRDPGAGQAGAFVRYPAGISARPGSDPAL